MVLELRNMAAHGCTNPNFHGGIRKLSNGTLDYTLLEKRLALSR
jgi:hypothetical protein